MPAKKIATGSGPKRYNPTENWWRARLSETGQKVRRVICVQYLEDLEKDGHTYYDFLGWLDFLKVKAVCGPIHDRDTFTNTDVLDWCHRHIDPDTGDLDVKYCERDVDPDTGERTISRAPYVGKPKKPHFHFGLMLGTQYDAEYFSSLFQGFCHIRPSMWDKMEDYEGFVNYLAHLKSPEKAQYSPFDIVSFGGADLSCLTRSDEMETLEDWADVMRAIKAKRITTFHQCVDMAVASGDFATMRSVKANSALIAQYFNSRNNERYWRNKLKNDQELIDPELIGKIMELIEESKSKQVLECCKPSTN